MKQEYSFQQIILRHLGFHMKKNELVPLPQFSSVARFTTPWTTARQASLSITNSQSLLKLMSSKSVMPSNHLILCHPPLLLPSIFPSTYKKVQNVNIIVSLEQSNSEVSRSSFVEWFKEMKAASNVEETSGGTC